MEILNYPASNSAPYTAIHRDTTPVAATWYQTVDWGRIIVECLFYLSIGSRVFAPQLGLLRFTGLSGAMILASATICLLIIRARHEGIPTSIYFALFINIFAVITDLVWLSTLNRDMIFWLSALLMACFIFRDERAISRGLLFIGACVAGALTFNAVFAAEKLGIMRLYLNKDGAGAMFANSNDLAQIACVTAVILLFRGISRPLVTKLVLYAAALGLAGVTLLTLSRQGIVFLVVGFVLYFIALLLKRNRSFELIIITAAIAVFTFYNMDSLTEVINGYAYRFTQDSGRTNYWMTALRDMKNSLLAGHSSINAYSFDGSLPHSTFLWLHLAFGGVCAWIYALWVAYLGWQTSRFVLGHGHGSWPIRIETLTIFLMFLAAQFTTVFAPGNYAFILCVAILEGRFITLGNRDTKDGRSQLAP
ncbi:MAG: O-antigen ligase family protein [Desulfuromonadales bacterium]|nr:O-antigen ligase family protein [Desulfuromonadales bacterium]